MFDAKEAKKLTELKEKQFIADHQEAINKEILKCEKAIREVAELRYFYVTIEVEKEFFYYVYSELIKRGFEVTIPFENNRLLISWN